MIKKNAHAKRAVHVSLFLAIMDTLPAEKGFKKEKSLHNSLSHSKQMNGSYFYTSSTGPLFHFDKA